MRGRRSRKSGSRPSTRRALPGGTRVPRLNVRIVAASTTYTTQRAPMSFLLFAQDAQPGGFMNSPMFLPFMIGLMIMFWLVVLRPMSRRQQEEQAKLLANLKRG